jgi:hypothetical protein
MSFENLKRNRGTNLDKLRKEVDKLTNKGSGEKDPRFWNISVDAAGNGSAVLRFMPAPEGFAIPFIQYHNHAFKGVQNRWYIENSLTSIGKDDPVGEFNSALWEGTTDDDDPRRKQVRAQKRKLNYVANVYIVKDPQHPENEGKVFLFKFGKKIFDKINDKMNPLEEDIQPIDPFDLWEGANFRLRAKKQDGQRNYDTSAFDSPSELLGGDDEKLQEVYSQIHSFDGIVEYKTYEELKKRLNYVLDLETDAPKKSAAKAKAPVVEDEEEEEKVDVRSKEKAKPPVEPKSKDSDDEDEEEFGLEYFKNLGNSDDD